jgi:hypothetical protein
MILGRFILRFLLVPFGIAMAVSIGLLVMLIGEWSEFSAYVQAHPDSGNYALNVLFFSPWILLVLTGGALQMLSPALVGIAISEFFAVRSWIFHLGNGVLSAWIGWSLVDGPRGSEKLFQDPKLVLLMGLVAGIAYWLIAGWSAGFWKPVFRGALPPAQPSPMPAPDRPAA